MRPIRIAVAVSRAIATGVLVTAPLPTMAQQAIEDVVVTATRMPRTIEDIAGTVTVITGEEIKRQIVEDLDDLVRYQPGISMDTAGRGGNQGFIIRGISGNRVLTIVDGVRSNDQYFAGISSYGKDAYETDDIKSVEIIRGPASVLYGADAMGGAVIVHTKDPIEYVSDEDALFFGARFSGSSADEQGKLGVTGAFQGERWGVLAQYTGRAFSETERNNGVRVNPLDGQSHGLLLKTTVAVNESHDLSFALDTFDEIIDIRLDNELSSSITGSTGRDETERLRIGVDHDWHIDSRFADEIRSQLYWQTTEGLQHTRQQRTSYSFINPMVPSTYAGTEAERITDFEFNQEVRGLSLTADRTVSSGSAEHHIVYGLMLEATNTERPRNRCEYETASKSSTCSIAPYPFAPRENFPNRTFPDTETTRNGLFVQDEIILGAQRRLTLIPGLRYDRYEMDPNDALLLDVTPFGFDVVPTKEDNVSSNLGLLYEISDQLTFVTQYSEGFRPPNFDESNQAFINRAFGYGTIPNPDLRPETSEGVELGLRVSKERARLGVTWYQNNYEDFISSRFVGTTDGISLFQDRNTGRARIEGLEFTGQWLMNDRWELFGSLAHARGEDRETGAPLDSVDPLTGVLGARFASPSDRWDIETLVTMVGDKNRVSAEDRVTGESYQLVDVIGQFRVNDNWSLRLGVYNLFDESYARWANVQGLAANDVEAIARAQAPGTNLRIGFDIDF